MQRLTIAITFLGLAACSAVDSDPTPPSGAGGKTDLPNDSIFDLEHDGRGYAEIARHYAALGYDLQVDLEALAPSWPMHEMATAALNRFGTPIQFSGWGYFHTALDVFRADVQASDEVVAPFGGVAIVFDWFGTPGYSGHDYGTVVAIWDPQSHVIAQLMHVRPTQALIDAGGEIDVEAGELIATLADDLSWIDAEHQQRLRHTHADLIDGGNMIALNPARYFPYGDAVAPQVLDLYLLDAAAQRHDELITGELDIVLEIADRDDVSERNFEAGSICYEITDQDGAVLASSERCFFEHMFESIETSYSFRARSLLDFGNAQHQIDRGNWPGSDVDDRERSFRYALTQFSADADGRCIVVDDELGFIEVSDTVSELVVTARVWDQRDNPTDFVARIPRTSPTPPPLPPQ